MKSDKRMNKLRAMLERQKGICIYCELPVAIAEATFDHITPVSKGGSNKMSNLIACHLKCNLAKANFSSEEEVLEYANIVVVMIRRGREFKHRL